MNTRLPAPPLRRNPDYLKWFVGDVFADAGSAIRAFAMPIIALAITDSLSLAGIVGASTTAAAILTMIPGGVLADRYDRKKLLLTGHLFGAVVWGCAIALYFTNTLNAATLVTVGILTGVRSGLFDAAGMGALKQLIDSRQLPTAIANNQARDGAIELGSGPVGGFLVAIAIWLPFAVQTVGHAISWFFIRTIKSNLDPRTEGQEVGTAIGQVKAGFRWLFTHRTIFILILIAAVISFASSGLLLTVILHLADAGTNEAKIGLVSTALAGGMIAGSVAASWFIAKIPTGKLGIGAMFLTSAAAAGIASTSSFSLTLAFLVGAGFSVPVFNAGASGWAVSQIPNSKMGAITAASGVFNMGLMPLAPIVAGFGLEHLGRKPTVIFFAVLVLASTLVMAGIREFRQLPKAAEWQDLFSRDSDSQDATS